MNQSKKSSSKKKSKIQKKLEQQLNLPLEKISDTPFRYNCCITDKKHKKKPIYAIKFNQFTHRKIFAVAAFSRVLIMECPEISDVEYDYEYYGIKELKVYEDPNDSFFAVAWGFDTRNEKTLLAAGGQNGIIHIVEGVNRHLSYLKAHGGAIYDLIFNPKNLHILASSSDDYSVRLWNVRTMICIAVFAGVFHESQVLALEFDFHGKYLVSCGMDKEILVWNLNDIENVIASSDKHFNPRLPFKTARITEFASRSNSLHGEFVDSIVRFGESSFITRSANGEIVMWKIMEVDGKPSSIDLLHSLNDDTKEESCWFIRMSLDQQGQFLSVGDLHGNIKMWDLDVDDIDDVKVSIFATQNQKLVRMMSYSRDGSTMIVASDDGKILRYDKKAAIIKKEVISNQ